MKSIEKKLKLYYKQQTEAVELKNKQNAPKRKMRLPRPILKIAAAAVLLVAVLASLPFINRNTPTPHTPPVLMNNSNDTESTDFQESTVSDITAEPSSKEEQRVIYADDFHFTGGGAMIKNIDDLFPLPNFYIPDFWESIKNDQDALYYVTLRPRCLEYSYYERAIRYDKDENAAEGEKYKYANITFKEYREACQWMIDADAEVFASFGIDAKLHWYGVKYNASWNKISDYENNFIYQPEDSDKGAFFYFYTAYVSGEVLLKYEKTLRAEYEKILPAYYETVRKYHFDKYGRIINDYSELYFDYAWEAMYGGIVTDGWTMQIDWGDATDSEIAEMVQSRWQEYTANGLRPPYACGGAINLLPEGYTEREIAYRYYEGSMVGAA